MIKKDLQLLHRNHLIDEPDFKYLISCFAQIDMLKIYIKQRAEKYEETIKKLKGKVSSDEQE